MSGDHITWLKNPRVHWKIQLSWHVLFSQRRNLRKKSDLESLWSTSLQTLGVEKSTLFTISSLDISLKRYSTLLCSHLVTSLCWPPGRCLNYRREILIKPNRNLIKIKRKNSKMLKFLCQYKRKDSNGNPLFKIKLYMQWTL